MGNTVTSSYIIDSYPLQSTSVINFYAVFLNLSAFINPVCSLKNKSLIAEMVADLTSSVLYCTMAGHGRIHMDVYHAGFDRCSCWNGCICIIALVWGVGAEEITGAIMGKS
jgi:hypothetical protein